MQGWCVASNGLVHSIANHGAAGWTLHAKYTVGMKVDNIFPSYRYLYRPVAPGGSLG